MILINVQIIYVHQKCLNELVGAGNIVKGVSGNGIHDSGIVSIEG